MDETDDVAAAQRVADQGFLGLELEPTSTGTEARFTLTGTLARHDGKLYGGTAIGVATALAEAATGRRALWTTVQFVSGATTVGDELTCRAEVLAAGRRTSQVRVRAWCRGAEIFCALGATTVLKPNGLTVTLESAPVVLPPEDCTRFQFPVPESMRTAEATIEGRMEMRVAREPGEPERPLGAMRFWARSVGHVATPPVLAYLADMIPMSIAHAAGRMGGGTSLDNTVRFGAPADDEWVLLDLLPHQAVGGFGHGSAHLWSRDGRLLGTASQTASLLLFD